MQKVTRTAALLLVALAGVLLLAAAVIALRRPAANALPPSQPTAVAGVQVVVAARDLPAGLPIQADALELRQLPQLPTGALADPAPLVGRVPAAAIAAATPVTSALLARGVALTLAPGERALAVPVDELSAAGNRIAPGDYVDVFMSLGSRRGGLQDEDVTQARLLLSRLRVLGYGSRDVGDATPSAAPAGAAPDATPGNGRAAAIAGRGREDGGATATAPGAARSAVLAVPVEQAARLLLGAQSGKLFLALRNPGDAGQPDLALFPQPRGVLRPRLDLSEDQRERVDSAENAAFAGIDGEGLAGHGPAPTGMLPAPARAPRAARPSTPSLEIIRGGQSGALSP